MQATEITASRRKEWNAFVSQQPFFMLMQTWEWGEFKENTGWKAVRLAVEENNKIVAGAQILIKSAPLGLASAAYIPRGPIVNWNDKAVTNALLSAMNNTARRHRCISLKIEPAIPYTAELAQLLAGLGFKESDFNNQPQCSMLVDLAPDEDTILANMNKTTRYNIRYSERNGIEVRQADTGDFNHFYNLLTFTAARAGFPVRAKAYYEQEWHSFIKDDHIQLFIASYEGEVLAVRMPAAFGNIAATLHSGSYNNVHKKLKPNELLMWHSIQWAKAKGCSRYDVWGIPNAIGEEQYKGKPLPEDQQGGLWGVYQFKRGFGGELIYYIGTYDYVYSKPLNWLMNIAMDRLGSLDKLAQIGDKFSLKADDQTVGM